eukprot:Rmarinus@m.28127
MRKKGLFTYTTGVSLMRYRVACPCPLFRSACGVRSPASVCAQMVHMPPHSDLRPNTSANLLLARPILPPYTRLAATLLFGCLYLGRQPLQSKPTSTAPSHPC